MSLWLSIIVLIFSRLYGLNWGAPFYFHPDENNIASALANLSCPNLLDPKTCFEPGFYAYGQFFLYLAYPIYLIWQNPNLSLRFLSAISSIASGIVLYKLLQRDFKSNRAGLIGMLLFTFTPVLIQLAHFGTTESFSVLLFLLALYYRRNMFVLALFVGFLTATKISQASLFILLLLSFVFYQKNRITLLYSIFIALVIFVFSTPHYFLNFKLFWPSFSYEAAVATGQLPVFYTEQFKDLVPFWFELKAILLPSVGILILALALFGFLVLVKKKRFYVPLLFLFLGVQNLITFAKWARFFVFIYPLLIYLAVVSLWWLSQAFKQRKGLLIFVIICQFFFAAAFFRLYLTPDTRMQADDWINNNLPVGSTVLTESANVIDLPINRNNFLVNSVFLYDLGSDPVFSKQINTLLMGSDYVIIPSRRVIYNYSCFRFLDNKPEQIQNCRKSTKYPEITNYYQRLFSKQYKLIKTFKLFADENFEETLTVFDHPTIRIYQQQH